MKRTVADIMVTDLVTVRPRATVRELIQILADEGITGAPVVEEDGRTLGVVSATDVLRLAAHEAEVPAAGVSPGTPPWKEREKEPEDEEAAGFFTSRRIPADEVLGSFDLPEACFDEYTVADIMTTAAFTVGPGESIPELADFLLRGRIHRALVMDGTALLGIVTTFDVLRTLTGEDAAEGSGSPEPAKPAVEETPPL